MHCRNVAKFLRLRKTNGRKCLTHTPERIVLQDVRCIYDRKIQPIEICGDKLPGRYVNDANILNNNLREKADGSLLNKIKTKLTNCVHQLKYIDFFLVEKGSKFPQNFSNLINEHEKFTYLKSKELLATSYYYNTNKVGLLEKSIEDATIENQQLIEESDIEKNDDYYFMKSDNPTYNEFVRPYTQTIIIENRWLKTAEWEEIFDSMECESDAYTKVFLMNSMLEFLSMCNCAYRDSLDIKKHLNGEVMRSLVEYSTLDKNIKLTQRGMGQYIYELCKYEMYDVGYNIYDKIYSKKCKFFGPNLQYSLIKLLSNTEHWEKGIPLLQYIGLSKQLTNPDDCFYFLFRAAMRFGTYEDVIEFYKYAVRRKMRFKRIDHNMFSDFLKYFGYSEDPVTWERNKKLIFHFVEQLKKNNIHFQNITIAIEFANWLKSTESRNWKGRKFESTNILHGLKCPVTGNSMRAELITDDECRTLGRDLYHNIINAEAGLKVKTDFEVRNNSNLLINTIPHELEKFVKFLLSTGPYDFVVDGMNVYYTFKAMSRFKRKHQNGFVLNQMSSSIDSIKKQLFGMRKIKTLIIFRQHVHNECLASDFARRTDSTNIHFLVNRTADDYFITLAALMSGKNTYVLSNDLFRNARQLISNPYLFHKWQRQVQCNHATRRGCDYLVIHKPQPFDVNIQQINGNWYLPYYNPGERDDSGLPKNWLLLYSDDGEMSTQQTQRGKKTKSSENLS